MAKAKKPDDLLPLTPAVFHILLALVDGEKHGYSIMQEVDEMSGGQVSMGPGTLYGSIKRMVEAGLIEETEKPADSENEDQRRRYYKITQFGEIVAEAEARRLSRLMNVVKQKHLTGGAR